MDNNKSGNIISINEKVCYNCKHRIWAVGIGLGVMCGNNKKNGWYTQIPGLRKTCDAFVMQEDKDRKPYTYK